MRGSLVKVEKARGLRKDQTDAEGELWRVLRNRYFGKHKFRRQETIGRYIVDFVCFERKLIVELDGGQHSENKDYDDRRTAWLSSQGFKVLRFWNHEVLGNFETVEKVIWDSLSSLSPYPPPSRWREKMYN